MKTRSWFRFAAAVGFLAAFGCDSNVNDDTVPTFAVLMLSRSSEGVAGDNLSVLPSSSHDGSRVAFMTSATNLDPLDNNNLDDVYVRDTELHTTHLVSINDAGTASGNNGSSYASISPDGRFVAFLSLASDLTAPGFDTNNCFDVFVRDLLTGVTVPATVNTAGTAISVLGASLFAGENYIPPRVTSDSTYVYVTFTSRTSDLVASPTVTLFRRHVYLRRIPIATFDDPTTGVTVLVSQEAGVEANDLSHEPCIGMEGAFLFVAWSSNATNLNVTDASPTQDIFWKAFDKATLAFSPTALVSVNDAGTAGGNATSSLPAISASGGYVAFESSATDLLPVPDDNGLIDVFVHGNILSPPPTTQIVSISIFGEQASEEARAPSISADGSIVAFESLASNLTPNDSNGYRDIFIFDLNTVTLTREPLTFFGGASNSDSHFVSIAGDGMSISFLSIATNLLPGTETNYVGQIFQRRFSP